MRSEEWGGCVLTSTPRTGGVNITSIIWIVNELSARIVDERES